MKKTSILIVFGFIAVGTVSWALLPKSKTSPKAGTTERRSKIQVPLFFIENQGQLDPRVDYYLPGRDKSLYFNAQGMTYSLANPDKKDSRWNVKVDFLNADSKTSPEGQSVQPPRSVIFKGQALRVEDGRKDLRLPEVS
jgi:hypothetical protein